jgi:hypothetical protein
MKDNVMELDQTVKDHERIKNTKKIQMEHARYLGH